MTAALAIILFVVLASTAVGILAGRRQPLDLENWTVGGRRFGVLLMWLLMAGEVYTTFTFLGASGWAYTEGRSGLLHPHLRHAGLHPFLSSSCPRLWRIGKSRSLHTQPDFFTAVYGSRSLGIAVAVIGILSILPYLQLQLKGLGLIVEVASGGAVSSSAAIVRRLRPDLRLRLHQRPAGHGLGLGHQGRPDDRRRRHRRHRRPAQIFRQLRSHVPGARGPPSRPSRPSRRHRRHERPVGHVHGHRDRGRASTCGRTWSARPFRPAAKKSSGATRSSCPSTSFPSSWFSWSASRRSSSSPA